MRKLWPNHSNLINLTPKLKNVVLSKMKRPWCWERLRAGGEGDGREWDGWMASPTQWTWVWVISGSWWWTGKPGVLQSMGSQSQTQLSNWTEVKWLLIIAMMQYIWSNIELLDRVQNEAPELCLFCGGYVCLSTFCFSSLHLSSLSSKECKCTFCFLFTFVLFLGFWGRVRHFPCPCSSRTSANQIKA